jgi:hypothetical protein
VDAEDGYFDEPVAARYDESAAEMFDPEVVDPAVELLAELAGEGAAREEIGVTIGDFSTTTVDGRFSVAYVVFNTIMNLRTQDAQVACFRNVAAHLEPRGCFVVEVMVPELQRLPFGETFCVFDASEQHSGFDEYDVVNQGLVSHHFSVVDGQIERSYFRGRYVWPAELDLMAELAGMRLRERWGGWRREPLTSESRQHVSVWEK